MKSSRIEVKIVDSEKYILKDGIKHSSSSWNYKIIFKCFREDYIAAPAECTRKDMGCITKEINYVLHEDSIEFCALRSFNDIKYMRNCLVKSFPMIAIPPLPSDELVKNMIDRLAHINPLKNSNESLAPSSMALFRMRRLQYFFDELVALPDIFDNINLRNFIVLSNDEWKKYIKQNDKKSGQSVEYINPYQTNSTENSAYFYVSAIVDGGIKEVNPVDYKISETSILGMLRKQQYKYMQSLVNAKAELKQMMIKAGLNLQNEPEVILNQYEMSNSQNSDMTVNRGRGMSLSTTCITESSINNSMPTFNRVLKGPIPYPVLTSYSHVSLDNYMEGLVRQIKGLNSIASVKTACASVSIGRDASNVEDIPISQLHYPVDGVSDPIERTVRQATISMHLCLREMYKYLKTETRIARDLIWFEIEYIHSFLKTIDQLEILGNTANELKIKLESEKKEEEKLKLLNRQTALDHQYRNTLELIIQHYKDYFYPRQKKSMKRWFYLLGQIVTYLLQYDKWAEQMYPSLTYLNGEFMDTDLYNQYSEILNVSKDNNSLLFSPYTESVIPKLKHTESNNLIFDDSKQKLSIFDTENTFGLGSKIINKNYIQHKESNSQHKESNVQHQESNVQHQESNVQHQESNVQHQESNVQHQESNVQHQESNVQHQESNVQHQESNVQHRESLNFLSHRLSENSGYYTYYSYSQSSDETLLEPFSQFTYE